jgi:predicted CXXCH cytochrome family protein
MKQWNRIRENTAGDVRTLMCALVLCWVSGILFSMPFVSSAAISVENTKHNLSVSGTGTIRSGTESRICVFCHTPFNSTPQTPLWNKAIEPQTYSVYESPTLRAPQPLPQPSGATRLCLTCHDGTIALGTVVSGEHLGLGSPLTASSPAYFGLDLSTHHPVSFSYSSSLPHPELADPGSLPPGVLLGGGDIIHCTSCHNPHDDSKGMFLTVDNRYSTLCLACHQDPDWSTSGHATSTDPVAGVLPVAPKTWPNWPTVAEWGCGVCHWPHFAQSSPLLNFPSSDHCLKCHSDTGVFGSDSSGGPIFAGHSPAGIEVLSDEISSAPAGSGSKNSGRSACATCHSEKGSVSAESEPVRLAAVIKGPATSEGYSREGRRADIRGQMKKRSGHRIQPVAGRSGNRQQKAPLDVDCVDCHNPHKVKRQSATAPYLSGMLKGVSGIDRDGLEIHPANYEYEICFKCHGDFAVEPEYVPRVVTHNSLRLAFEPENPSYHPVVETGKNPGIPSLSLPADDSESRLIYCTDCHRDDAEVSKGPHGSSYPPILRARYEMEAGTEESLENYALCYKCHDRTSILRDDSFRTDFSGRGGHSGHLASGASCSVCHSPHGVIDDGVSGSHTHLINFDTRAVSALSGNTVPFFTDNGSFSGSCTLVCHGKIHDNLSY